MKGASAVRRCAGWAAVCGSGALAAAGCVVFMAALALAFSNAISDSPSRESRTDSAGHRPMMSLASEDSASTLVRAMVAARTIPGAAVAIGTGSRVLEMTGYGRVGWKPTADPVSADSTVYDLASLTKAVATTTAVLLLAQDGKIDLNDPVQRTLPEFKGKWKEGVTWLNLLTHTSGLPAGTHIRGKTEAQRLRLVLETPLRARPGSYVQYSDLSFVTLWAAAQRAAGEPLPNFLERRVWRPLGMTSTSFWPGLDCNDCAPTELLKSGELYRGKPSDPIAHALGMPTGNAGLFSTARDLSRFAQMIVNGGELDGQRILQPGYVKMLFQQIPHAGHRSLGWEAFCPNEHLTQDQPCQHPVAYGHTGWTGTSLWIDPVRGVWVVILSNRSFNVKRPQELEGLRADVFERALDRADTTH